MKNIRLDRCSGTFRRILELKKGKRITVRYYDKDREIIKKIKCEEVKNGTKTNNR